MGPASDPAHSDQSFTTTIDGLAAVTASTIDVINPATEKVFASRADAGRTEPEAAVDPAVPFGGAGESGIGCEYSSLGLAGYTQVQVVTVAK